MITLSSLEKIDKLEFEVMRYFSYCRLLTGYDYLYDVFKEGDQTYIKLEGVLQLRPEPILRMLDKVRQKRLKLLSRVGVYFIGLFSHWRDSVDLKDREIWNFLLRFIEFDELKKILNDEQLSQISKVAYSNYLMIQKLEDIYDYFQIDDKEFSNLFRELLEVAGIVLEKI